MWRQSRRHRGRNRPSVNADSSSIDESTVPNIEAYRRINFLFQLSNATIISPPDKLSVRLSRHYNSTLRGIAERLVIRLHTTMKSSICRRCKVSLIEGVTSATRLRRSHTPAFIRHCALCKYQRRIATRNETESPTLDNTTPQMLFTNESAPASVSDTNSTIRPTRGDNVILSIGRDNEGDDNDDECGHDDDG